VGGRGSLANAFRRAPWTIEAAIAIWLVFLTVEQFAVGSLHIDGGDFPDQPLPGVFRTINFVYPYLLIVLLGHGLLRHSTFAWSVAFVWLALQALGGTSSILFNHLTWFQFTHFIFWEGTWFPLLSALSTGVLLLLPPTAKWMTSKEQFS
jgi:hypothetical protein